MKQKDIAVIVAVAGISTIIAFVIGNIAFGSPKHRQIEVQSIDSISSDFPVADQKYFNSQSIDSTQTVKIGTSTNPKPFNN